MASENVPAPVEKRVLTADVEPSEEWAAAARQALAASDTRGTSKLTRRRLACVLQQLSIGMPLESVARANSIRPQNLRAWGEERPAIAEAIERARAAGELVLLNRIHAATDWRAAQWILGKANEAYRDGQPVGNPSGTIKIEINVPRPQPVDVAPAIDAIATVVPDDGEPTSDT